VDENKKRLTNMKKPALNGMFGGKSYKKTAIAIINIK